MVKRRKRRPTSRDKGSQSASALRRNGQRAFDRSDYAGAIAAWEQAAQRTSQARHKTRLAPALAEAYFRRGLNQLYGRTRDLEAGLSDLGEAVSLQPGDPCYVHHLGLAAHRQGDLDRAIDAYRIARQDERFAARAAYPLALALLASGEDVSADPVWDELSAEERAMLGQARAFRRRPYALSSDAPLLWQALAVLDAGLHSGRTGGVEQARLLLQQFLALGQETASLLPGDRLEQGVAYYYLGVIAAREGDWQEAGQQWGSAHVAGWDSLWLQANLAELYHRIAEGRLSAGDAEGALDAAIEADRHIESNKRLDALFSHAYQRLAYDAVSAGDWEQALDYWEDASEVGGSSFRLAYNRALAYERLEDYVAAGEFWREALRRRPRRADHPDAISDEQVARLWRRAAEAYHKAGDFDEAVNVYRLALKWNPDDLDTRMVLAEGLIDDGRLQAAENELHRILERDPDNVPALLRVGEVILEIDRWWDRYGAVRSWERALELEPENAEARQNLVEFYRDEANNRLYWGEVLDAIKLYRQALDHQPESGRTLAALGRCFFFLNDAEVAHSHVERALENAGGDLEVYGDVIQIWLEQSDGDRAWQVVSRAESDLAAKGASIPYVFYLAQAAYCIEHDYDDFVRPWLNRTVEEAPPGEPVLVMIGEMAMVYEDLDLARAYLERGIEAGQQVGQAHLVLGLVAARAGDIDEANEHWDRAEEIALDTDDAGLQERIEMTRSMFTPMGWLQRLLGMPGMIDPTADDGFMDALYGEDWDEDDDDEF